MGYASSDSDSSDSSVLISPRAAQRHFSPKGAVEPGIEEKADIDALFTHNKQIWDKRAPGNWITRPSGSQAMQASGSTRLIFQAYDRSYGPFGPSSDDHTWIVIQSQPLVDLLRSEALLKGVEGLDQTPPGIDARHIFLRLSELNKRVAMLQADHNQRDKEPVLENSPLPKAGFMAPTLAGLGIGTNTSRVSDAVQAASHNWLPPFAALFSTFSGVQPKEKPSEVTSGRKKSTNSNKSTLPPQSIPSQLSELLRFVEEHFARTQETIKRLQDDGLMSYQQLWTMCAPDTIIESQDEATGKPIGIRVESWDYGSKGDIFKFYGTTYHWNGKMFHSKEITIQIPRFKGLLKAKLLPIQLLSDGLRARLVARGILYKKYSGLQHLRYNSFIYVYNKKHRSYFKLQAHGKVIIDATGFDRFGSNIKARHEIYEYSYSTPKLEMPKTFPEQFDADFDFSDDILCLMPPTQLGFSFTAKLWGHISVEDLSEIVFNEHAFDRLVLSDDYKEVIKAQVETFSLKSDQLASDLVDNKGGGMIMVLHGNPGTGKTLTAEAISEHLKCPLYMVSSGELGTFSHELERELRDIMMMAASWNAIVLIDEADVFLEARTGTDSVRNGRVSVFLRLLEYHTGVLILTTNRVRTFDKAFVSRFTIALHYPDLQQDSRLQIWREFLGRANITIGVPDDSSPSGPQYISHNDIMKLAKKSMNGRVIKQLVRGAQAIAIAKNEPMGLDHLQKVIGITEKFESDWKELGMADELEGDASKAERERSMYS